MNQGPRYVRLMEKSRGQKSRATVPLKESLNWIGIEKLAFNVNIINFSYFSLNRVKFTLILEGSCMKFSSYCGKLLALQTQTTTPPGCCLKRLF